MPESGVGLHIDNVAAEHAKPLDLGCALGGIAAADHHAFGDLAGE